MENSNLTLFRICNDCNGKIYYKTLDSFKHSIKNHIYVCCIYCNRRKNNTWKGKSGNQIPWTGRKTSDETKQLLSKLFSGNRNPNYGKPLTEKQKLLFNHTGEHLSESQKYNISKANSGEKCYWYGKKRSEETIDKIKQTIYNKMKILGYTGRYNKKACDFISEWGSKHGYNFQHALNGGEVIFKRYAVDGFDKEKNIIFEYDEPLHEKLGKKKEDLFRIKKLIEISNCKILRYSEKYNKFYWAFPNKSEIFI
jgi:hypothetical protein